MTVKKTTVAPAAKKVAEKKATKAAPAKKAAAKKVVYLTSENAGFRAGDVYQTLAAAEGKALSVAEIAKKANISVEDVYMGIGWLFKEGKIRDENNLVTLA
jgi:hypothetical protein